MFEASGVASAYLLHLLELAGVKRVLNEQGWWILILPYGRRFVVQDHLVVDDARAEALDNPPTETLDESHTVIYPEGECPNLFTILLAGGREFWTDYNGCNTTPGEFFPPHVLRRKDGLPAFVMRRRVGEEEFEVVRWWKCRRHRSDSCDCPFSLNR